MTNAIRQQTELFKVGDVVWLKSGGPAMTVWIAEHGLVSCCWFAGDHLETAVFCETELDQEGGPTPSFQFWVKLP